MSGSIVPESSSHCLLTRIREHGGKTVLHEAAHSRSYAELSLAIDDWRVRLQRDEVPPGATVALVADYSFAAIALFLALAANRNIIVPVTSTVAEEIRERVELARVGWIFRPGLDGWSFARLHDQGEVPGLVAGLVDSERAGLILFSSGSTGRPKAMVHDLDRLLETYRGKRTRNLTILVFLMFDHIGGLNTLFTALASGTTVVLPASRDADEICALISRHRVVVLPASPTFLNLILVGEAWKRHDLSSLKIVTYGTEPMPESLLQRLRRAFPAVRFVQTFGTSETGISHTSSKSSDSTLLKLDDPNTEFRIVDGELWLRSRTQILGYLNHTMDSFTDDGWFKTGDLVEQADAGYLRIVGRRKELINVGGEKVLPAEVESVLLEMPEVSDAIVFGESSAITGQIVCANIVLSASGNPASIRVAVRKFCRERLAGYKVPVKVTAVDRVLFGDRFKKVRLAGGAAVRSRTEPHVRPD